MKPQKIYLRATESWTDYGKKHKGDFFGIEKDMLYIDQDVDIYDSESKQHLLSFRKNWISPEHQTLAHQTFKKYAKKTTNRGYAAGKLDPSHWKNGIKPASRIYGYPVSKDGRVSRTQQSNPVYSGFFGYMNARGAYPCRMTQLTAAQEKAFMEAAPFLQRCNKGYCTLARGCYMKQRKMATKCGYNLHDTVFSSVTVNRNFRTALHVDKDDYEEGRGILTVTEEKPYSGGEFIMPRYNLAVNLRQGDLLCVDVHEWHCNNELSVTPSDPLARLSYVMYYRPKLCKCDSAK